MPFNVYPDGPTSALLGTPANTPVLIKKGLQFPGGLFVPLANNVGNDPAYFNEPTTFIRISMNLPASATPPEVELEANNPTAATTGPSVIINPATVAPGQALLDGTNPTEAASAYFLGPFTNNVYLLKVIITIPGTTLNMRLTNNTASDHDFVWVVADSDANSQQPWIQLSPTTLPYEALVNQAATATAQSLQITNRGTGTLTVNNINPALAAPYALNPAGLPNSGLPASVDPNQASPRNLVIGFNAPATTGGTAATNYTVDGDTGAVSGAGHNDAFQLSATTTALEVVMVLDDSGSMGATDTTSAATRLSELQSASKQFLDYLAAFGAAAGTVGIVRFPGTDINNPSDLTSYDLLPAETIPATMGSEKTAVDSMTPTDNTPMDFAIQEVLSRVAPRYFATDATSKANNRRWMLLMSDGKWNVGSDPTAEVTNLGPSNLNVVVFSAGYGQSGQVDYGTLQTLATGAGTTPGGQSYQVDVGAGLSGKALAQKFKTVITAGLTINTASDPDGIIFPGQATRYEVLITPYDTKAAFSLYWDTPNAGLTLELVTPTCDLITHQTATNTPGVKFNSDVRYQMYVIDGSYLRNDANPSQPRYGTWRLIVSHPAATFLDARTVAAVAVGEHYSYDVLTDSSLKLNVSLDHSVYYAGDPIGVSAKVTANGLPVRGASAQLSVTAPGQSMDNFLAAVPITADEYQNAAKLLAGKDAWPVYIKAFAAQLKGIVFKGLNQTTTIPMTDASDSGVYTATVDQTTIPDGHTLYVTVTGTTADGVAFRRDRSIEVRVGVKPDPVFTPVNIVYDPAQTNPNLVTGTINVTPRDRFGNFAQLVDPATSQYIVLKAQGATLDPTLSTTFNGTYSSKLSYQAGSTPAISLTVGGVPVFTGQTVPPVDQLHWVDEVLAFKPGLEGAAGANQHTKPTDVLGDIRTKPAGIFVSLGGYGSIIVDVNGQVILARTDDDVTVFVQPDDDLRPYSVEAFPATGGGWVSLGTSPGTTASFSLGKAKLTAASAIRITDQSGQTRDSASKPSATPGVSIRAVGAKSTTQAVAGGVGCERFFIGFFSHGGVASVANSPSRFVSPVDKYQYKQAEVTYEYYLHSSRAPAAGFVQGQLTPPGQASLGGGGGTLLWLQWDVDDATGGVSLKTSYYVQGGQETPTNDGCVKVYAACQRRPLSKP